MIKNFYAAINGNKIRKFSYLIIIIFTGLALVIYLNNFLASENLVQKQTEARELVLARSGALSIEEFLVGLGKDAKLLSKHKFIEEFNKNEAEKTLDNYINSFDQSSALIDVAVLDKNGTNINVANRKGIKTPEGQNFSYREYFKWTKDPRNRNKIYYSEPFLSAAGETKGHNIIAISTPIYINDKFNGAIIFIVDLEKFEEKFINPLRIIKNGEVWLVNQNGKLIAGEDKITNKSLIVYANEANWKGSDKFISRFKESLGKSEGTTSWIFSDPDSNINEQIVGFKRISGPGSDWIIYASISRQTVFSFLRYFYTGQQVGLIFIIAVFIITGLLFVVHEQITRRDSFKEGYEKALNELIRKKDKN